MIDPEVERLRRLRGTALRVRAVARSLSRSKGMLGDGLLQRSSCAAWRLSRAVSGRLRAHPYAAFQRDAGIGTLFRNSIVARVARFTGSNRLQALKVFESDLKALIRELDDARALTWASELSDAFGRSQREIHVLAASVANEMRYAAEAFGRVPNMAASERAVGRQSKAAAVGGDWPYLAF